MMAVVAAAGAQIPDASAPLRAQVEAFQQAGRIAQADSVLQVLDRSGQLNALDLLRWAQIKHIMGQSGPAGTLLCRASGRDVRLAALVQAQALRMLETADSTTVEGTLGAYGSCALALPGKDSAAVRSWLAQAYAEFGLNSLAAMQLAHLSAASSGSQLLDMAEEALLQGQSSEAVSRGLAAYPRLNAPEDKQRCASVLCDAYQHCDRLDSAVSWLRRTSPTQPSAQGAAATLYQRAGDVASADSIIALLPPGVQRDTLVIRQHLFAGRLPEALREAGLLRQRTHWRSLSDESYRWMLRTTLYSGTPSDASRLLDSAAIRPGTPAGDEIIGYRYLSKRIRTSQEAFGCWGGVELALYLRQPARAASLLADAHVTGDAQIVLAARIVPPLIRDRKLGEAIGLLGAVPAEKHTPELRYYLGEALLRRGELERGREVLRGLMLAHPHDVFSGRARILLGSIDRT